MTDQHLYREIVTTQDGSRTIYVPELNEHYHSKFGAIQESKHIFIDAGLKYYIEKNHPIQLNIFEVGFGTGLNTLLTILSASTPPINVYYETIEAYPVHIDEIKHLHYSAQIGNDSDLIFHQIHNTAWHQDVKLNTHFTIHKKQGFLQEWSSNKKFDIVYFDAFAPEVQSNLWTEEIFANLHHFMNKNGILVTYCVKGSVKRALKASGWKVEKLPGPPGKREIIRAYYQE
ncbi:MAG: tRNA (5-methylaminomethyl-2-thiouridine)(34)-methyltransferase MnmD [Chitinophagales bacterium]|nr:tRNA (5-methylaminomethyl-2-thiouridine)(34)-methyltransferase MnmD [Chitinophagales bacterium]